MTFNTEKPIWDNIKEWESLTEIPSTTQNAVSCSDSTQTASESVKRSSDNQLHNPVLHGVSPLLIKLLWDILVYLFSSVSVRIKRLGMSGRGYENAKHEGLEKGFFSESSAGATKYLIPKPIAFEAFNMPCPYERASSIEHSYYVLWGCFMLKKDPRYKNVWPEVKHGESGSTSDIVTVAHDGTRQALEITLSTTNILANAGKYINTNFIKIIFLCRDYKLKEAVKACCREGGLDPELLAKLDYMQFSTLLSRQRKMSLY